MLYNVNLIYTIIPLNAANEVNS